MEKPFFGNTGNTLCLGPLYLCLLPGIREAGQQTSQLDLSYTVASCLGLQEQEMKEGECETFLSEASEPVSIP